MVTIVTVVTTATIVTRVNVTLQVYRDIEKRLLKESYTSDDVVVVGVQGSTTKFTPICQLDMDVKKRVPISNWWLSLKPLIQILALPPRMHSEKVSATDACSHCAA